MPLTCGTVRGTCHPQRLGIIVDLYLAVLIAEKVHNWFDRTMEMPQLDGTSWRNMEDGFWMVSGQHPPNADCLPGLFSLCVFCCVDSPEP